MNSSIIEFIKNNWDCVTYARDVLGLPISHDGDRCKSWRPDAENPTSLLVQKNHWWDWGGNTHGDVIDMCAQARHNGDIGAAIHELAGNFYDPQIDNWQNYIHELDEKIMLWHKQLRPADIDYLHSRRINDATIERLRIGYDPISDRMTFPYWKNGHACYYITRDRSGKSNTAKYMKQKKDNYNEHVPWGLHTLTKNFADIFPPYAETHDGIKIYFNDILVVGEGMFDAMSFEQEGFHVLSPICGHFNKQQQDIFLAAAKNHKYVFICFDSDKAGTDFQLKCAKFCFSHRIKFKCGSLPHGIKDVSDYYAGGGSIPDLIYYSRDGLAVLAEKITDKDDFADYLRSASRFASTPDVIDLCAQAVLFPEEWRKALAKECTRPPLEKFIVDDVQKNHEMIYIVNSGFFEYSHGVYNLIPDEFAKKHIENALGNYATGARLASICSYLKTRLSSQEEFNIMHTFNFLNGMLDLSTGELKPHSTSFKSSVQAPYCYDASAKCPRFSDFIYEIMDGVQEKISLLQEMAGYILFPDCRLQKAFFLIGEGANGKSVLINTLMQVFGKKNCSNVDISQLSGPFDPIRIRYSLVNFSNETSSRLKDADSKFKACVTGDPISAAFKGKDAIEFSPRAKWICAANSFITSNDISFGFTRRICFVKFLQTFTGEIADKNLADKLGQELPGIFNWAYEGYKRLMKNQVFTVTDESNALKIEFIQSINPVDLFADEKLSSLDNTRRTSKELYSDYSKWAQEAGFKPTNIINFTRNLTTALRSKRPDTYKKRVGGETIFFFDSLEEKNSNSPENNKHNIFENDSDI